jgi:DNA-binding LacI/PurR family transcriptional regulator
MRTPGPELGRLGTEALIRQLEGATPLPAPHLIPAKLHLGESTAPPPTAR